MVSSQETHHSGSGTIKTLDLIAKKKKKSLCVCVFLVGAGFEIYMLLLCVRGLLVCVDDFQVGPALPFELVLPPTIVLGRKPPEQLQKGTVAPN